MSYYFLARIKIHDTAEYQRYIDGSEAVFSKYNGTYLAVDTDPEVIEGEFMHSRAVLIRFEQKKDFEAWYYSDDYQRILKHRLKAADCDTILIKGSV